MKLLDWEYIFIEILPVSIGLMLLVLFFLFLDNELSPTFNVDKGIYRPQAILLYDRLKLKTK